MTDDGDDLLAAAELRVDLEAARAEQVSMWQRIAATTPEMDPDQVERTMIAGVNETAARLAALDDESLMAAYDDFAAEVTEAREFLLHELAHGSEDPERLGVLQTAHYANEGRRAHLAELAGKRGLTLAEIPGRFVIVRDADRHVVFGDPDEGAPLAACEDWLHQDGGSSDRPEIP